MKEFLNIVLTKNYFNFAGKMFHQIQGTAMGTKIAPAYANIFMGDLEEKRIEDYHTTPIFALAAILVIGSFCCRLYVEGSRRCFTPSEMYSSFGVTTNRLPLSAFLMMMKECCSASMAFLWSAMICGFLACSILSSA